jgi:hypothetical protein
MAASIAPVTIIRVLEKNFFIKKSFPTKNVKRFFAKKANSFFSHPDCTVGSGIAPDHAQRSWLADFTAGREISSLPEESLLNLQLHSKPLIKLCQVVFDVLL